jgi:hypothetical protein
MTTYTSCQAMEQALLPIILYFEKGFPVSKHTSPSADHPLVLDANVLVYFRTSMLRDTTCRRNEQRELECESTHRPRYPPAESVHQLKVHISSC